MLTCSGFDGLSTASIQGQDKGGRRRSAAMSPFIEQYHKILQHVAKRGTIMQNVRTETNMAKCRGSVALLYKKVFVPTPSGSR